MDESSGQPMSAAQRRRQRRLRSMLRHEQQSIRMALATVMHHSFKVHTENGAPRSQTTATRAREGEVHEHHDRPRAQNRPLPVTRPEPLAEVSEPQGPAATVGYVAARPPLIWWGPKLLADSSAEAIDGRTLRYLLKENSARKKDEEEEEERSRTQQETSQLQQRGPPHSVRRKRKKRSKKRLPNSPLPRCRRPCDHQRHVLAVRGASVPVHRQSGGHSCMDLADPVSSGKYSAAFVFTAPVAEPTVMSFTVPFNGHTTATVVTSCSSSADCPAAEVFASRCRVVVDFSLLVVLTIRFGTL